MKRLLFVAVIVTISILLASAPTLFAGVVMAETSIAKGPAGETSSHDKIIYVQGNKQKIERQRVDAITDLDKSVIYIIDKEDRVYTEVPLQALGPSEPGESQSEPIQLNQTGKTRIIANHPCREYRAIAGNRLERITISACISTSAPGARELAEFERKMGSRLNGEKGQRSAGDNSTVLMLEKQSVVSFRVPNLSHGKPYRTASLLVKTRINDIQLKPLPADTFKPPKGFSKLRIPPDGTVPPRSPKVPKGGIEVIAPNLSAAPRTLPL